MVLYRDSFVPNSQVSSYCCFYPPICVVEVIMISINKLFLANIIFFGSTVVALRGESKNERRKVMSKKGHGTACHDIFPRTLFNGTEVNYVKLYSAVFVEGNTTNLLLDTLCEGFVDAYAATTNCSSVPGSYREVGSCKVITEASGPGPEESYLLELLYFTNAVDGTTMFSLVEAADDAECSCNCPFGIIPGIFEGTTCTCICAPKDVNCTCTSPFVGSVVSDLDAKMASSEFQILGVHQLQLLEDCNATSTTYDYEFVCPGFESVAFAFLSTDFPSASPTAAPSVYPTDFPSGKT